MRYDLDRVADIQLLQHAPSQSSDHGDLAANPVERLHVDPSALFYAGTTWKDTVVALKDSHGKKPEGDEPPLNAVVPFFFTIYQIRSSLRQR